MRTDYSKLKVGIIGVNSSKSSEWSDDLVLTLMCFDDDPLKVITCNRNHIYSLHFTGGQRWHQLTQGKVEASISAQQMT